MFDQFKREPKNPESLIGEEVGYVFLDDHGTERADTILVEKWEDGFFYGQSSYLETVRVTPEQIRYYYFKVYGMKEMLNNKGDK